MSNEDHSIKRRPIDLNKLEPLSLDHQKPADNHLIRRRQIDMTGLQPLSLSPEPISTGIQPGDPLVIDRRDISGRLKLAEQQILPEYQIVLEQLKRGVPEIFQQQAAEIARLFTQLDNGNPGPAARELASTIAELPSIRLLYNRFRDVQEHPTPQPADPNRRIRQITYGNPETSYPVWLMAELDKHRAESSRKNTDSDFQEVRDFYESWASQHRIRVKDEPNGQYSYYSRDICPPRAESSTVNFKIYIETPHGAAVLRRAFETLAQEKIHPYSSKMFDQIRLVMYYSTDDPQTMNKVKEVLTQQGITFRGPGQDSVAYRIAEDGKWDNYVKYSNDQGRGEGASSKDFAQTTFDRATFLKMYLAQNYRHWRNPINPYQMSFVPLFDQRTDATPIANEDKLAADVQATQNMGYEVAKIAEHSRIFEA